MHSIKKVKQGCSQVLEPWRIDPVGLPVDQVGWWCRQEHQPEKEQLKQPQVHLHALQQVAKARCLLWDHRGIVLDQGFDQLLQLRVRGGWWWCTTGSRSCRTSRHGIVGRKQITLGVLFFWLAGPSGRSCTFSFASSRVPRTFPILWITPPLRHAASHSVVGASVMSLKPLNCWLHQLKFRQQRPLQPATYHTSGIGSLLPSTSVPRGQTATGRRVVLCHTGAAKCSDQLTVGNPWALAKWGSFFALSAS